MSTPNGAMLGPVPLVALPRRALANVRAASAICAAGTPTSGATRSGVNGATADRSASNPCVSAATKLLSCRPSAKMRLSMAASSSTS